MSSLACITETLPLNLLQLFMTDVDTKFSQSIGWTMGERTARYAMIIDHGKVTYAELETQKGEITVSLIILAIQETSTQSRNLY